MFPTLMYPTDRRTSYLSMFQLTVFFESFSHKRKEILVCELRSDKVPT